MPIGSGSDADMKRYNWLKELTWLNIGTKPDADECVTVTEYDFHANEMPCAQCKSSDFIWIQAQRVGIYVACGLCKFVNGPISMSFGVAMDSKKISVDEAIKILRDRGVKRLPIEFEDNERKARLVKKQRALLRRKRKRPAKVA